MGLTHRCLHANLIYGSKELKEHFESTSDLRGKRSPAGTPLRSDRAITGNLAASAGPKHNVSEVFCWI